MSVTHPIIIIGAGHAGVTAAARLKELNWSDGIIMVDQQRNDPYERPPLSKDLLKTDSDGRAQLLRKTGWFEERGIQLLAGCAVTGIDRDAHVVQLSDGQVQPYHRLIIATGATARALPVPGADLPGVQMLKTHEDAVQLREALQQQKRIVVIGAGYIGMEVAAAATAAGCRTTVIEFQGRIMSRVTSEPISHFFENLHTQAGTEFRFSTGASEIQGDGRVERVLTNTGEIHEADVVVVGIGVIPNQDLAEQAGLLCNDGIIVDAEARTSDPHIYAIGDVSRSICQFENVDRRLECIQNATHQAAQAARSIMGADPAEPEIAWFWTVQHDKRLQTAGVRHPDDELVLRGDPAAGKFSVLYLREGRLAAIDTVGRLADFRQGKKLISARHMIDPITAADSDRPLSDSIRDLVTA